MDPPVAADPARPLVVVPVARTPDAAVVGPRPEGRTGGQAGDEGLGVGDVVGGVGDQGPEDPRFQSHVGGLVCVGVRADAVRGPVAVVVDARSQVLVQTPLAPHTVPGAKRVLRRVGDRVVMVRNTTILLGPTLLQHVPNERLLVEVPIRFSEICRRVYVCSLYFILSLRRHGLSLY